MSAVVQFPRRIQMTFGGEPPRKARSVEVRVLRDDG